MSATNCVSRVSIWKCFGVADVHCSESQPVSVHDSPSQLDLNEKKEKSWPPRGSIFSLQMTGGDSNDVPTDNSVTDGSRAVDSKLLMNRRDYMIGIALLFVVVFLWTSSNFITQVEFLG